MAKRLQLRRGTTAQTNGFVGALSEVTIDTEKDVLVVHDGVTAGGFPNAARANANGTISLIKKDGTVITTIPATGLFNNTLTSLATDQAATAAQAKVLKDLVDTKLTATDAAASANKLTTAVGSAPSYSARAWVSFFGAGSLVITGQGNVSSITDNGLGDYTINFATEMLGTSYAVALAYASGASGDAALMVRSDSAEGLPTLKTTKALRVIYKANGAATLRDISHASVVIYQ